MASKKNGDKYTIVGYDASNKPIRAKRRATLGILSSPKPKPKPAKVSDKFDWKKELRKAGFKISRDGIISKTTKVYRKGPKALKKKAFVEKKVQFKTKVYTKEQALNSLAREKGWSTIKSYFKFRKQSRVKEFIKKGKDAGVDTDLGSPYVGHLHSWSDAGFPDRGDEIYEVLYDLDYVDESDYDRYMED